MAVVKSCPLRWGLIVLCMVMGTWLGIFLQHFQATSFLFGNIVDFSVDIRQIDLVMFRFGFFFALKLNLGTLCGGLLGVYLAR